MNAEDRLKIKEYKYERLALIDFIDKHSDEHSIHVKNAVMYRLNIVYRELKTLGWKDEVTA